MKNVIVYVCLMLFISDLTVAQNYCVPSFSGNTIFIDNFAFHTLINIYSSVDEDEYVAYPDSLFTTTVTIGKTYPITISTDHPSGIYGKFGAWIDYNDDGIFDNAELIHYDSLSKYSTSGLVTIPNDNTIIGLRRLRIISAWYPPTITPCGDYNDGEGEDYLIHIVANQPDTQTYCMPFNPEGSNNFNINYFHFGELKNDNSGSNASNYVFYQNDLFSADLLLNTSYEVFISKGTTVGNTGGYAVWIDLNNDGDFSITERLYYSGPNLTSTTGTITIPNDSSITGSHRLRVRSAWGRVPENPCGLYSGGETEDYLINILGTPTSVETSYSNEEQLEIFPNPSNGNFYIESTVNKGEVEIYTYLGERIFKEHLSSTSLKEINLKNIYPGIYILTLFDGVKYHVRQFIVE